MTQKIAPTLTWEENEKGTLIGTATLDNGAIVQYKCINMGDDDNPKWVHLRAMCFACGDFVRCRRFLCHSRGI